MSEETEQQSKESALILLTILLLGFYLIKNHLGPVVLANILYRGETEGRDSGYSMYISHGEGRLVMGIPIDINMATIDDLQALPGIGPRFAERIVDMRMSIGDFLSIDDMKEVKGLGKKRLKAIRPFITCVVCEESNIMSQEN